MNPYAPEIMCTGYRAGREYVSGLNTPLCQSAINPHFSLTASPARDGETRRQLASWRRVSVCGLAGLLAGLPVGSRLVGARFRDTVRRRLLHHLCAFRAEELRVNFGDPLSARLACWALPWSFPFLGCYLIFCGPGLIAVAGNPRAARGPEPPRLGRPPRPRWSLAGFYVRVAVAVVAGGDFCPVCRVALPAPFVIPGVCRFGLLGAGLRLCHLSAAGACLAGLKDPFTGPVEVVLVGRLRSVSLMSAGH